jgi:SAM-dependent methyltransferase
MGLGAPLRWLENHFLARYLRGRGIEIGALWRRFPVHPQARVYYVDRSNIEDLKAQYTEVRKKIFRPDLVADATELPVSPGTLDFLIASHVLEHLPFPLSALKAWYRTLAPGGVLLLKVPDKRYTFDFRRSRTPLSRLIYEHEHPESFDWQAHYLDAVENIDGRKPSATELANAVPGLRAGTFNIHYQVWIDEDLIEMIDFTRQAWGFDWQPVVSLRAHFYRKEAAVLLRRQTGTSQPPLRRSESELGTLRAGVCQPRPSDPQACPHFALLTATTSLPALQCFLQGVHEPNLQVDHSGGSGSDRRVRGLCRF